MESIIEVQDVTKSFKGATVLRQINISFEKGKIHGIIGRNGSGKTVLIKTICGLIHPDQGKVIVDGKVIGKDVDFPESIGAIIEAPGFLPSVSAFRNLSYLASLRGRIGRDEIRAAISCSSLGGAGERRLFSRRSFCSLRRCRDSRFLAACSFLRSTAWTTSKPSATSRRSCRRSLCSLLAMRIFSTS